MHTTENTPTPLPWTGERYIPEVSGQVELEHVHRYLLAQEYAQDKDVLDIACGEGYGSAMLSKVARSVFGVDIDPSSVAHASSRYSLPNVRFAQGSCLNIPIESNTIDLIVCFETLEHLAEHKAMLTEFKRVLRPGGTLMVSTPDKQEYSISTNYRNPFHVLELFRHEFKSLIESFFTNYSILGQQVVYGSAIFPEAPEARLLNYHIEDTSHPNQRNLKSRYVIAIASDGALPPAIGGLLEEEIEKSEPLQANLAQYRAAAEHARAHAAEDLARSQAAGELARSWASEEVARSQAAAELACREFEKRGRNFEQQLRWNRSEYAGLEKVLKQQLAEAEAENRRIKSSLSWRITRHLRRLNDIAAGWNRKSGKAPLKQAALQHHPVPAAPVAPLAVVTENTAGIPPLLFSEAFYLRQMPKDSLGSFTPLEHYQVVGWREGYNPHPLFNVRWYLERYPEVAAQDTEPLLQYVTHGWQTGRNPNPYFDCQWYLAQYPDVAKVGIEPLQDYVANGLRERRNPGPHFDAEWYLMNNPDVRDAGLEPLTHYLDYGCVEGRYPNNLDKELAGLRSGEYARWIETQCRTFLSPNSGVQSPEDQVGDAVAELKSAMKDFVPAAKPEASIIIAVHNKASYTLASITAIFRSKPRHSFEIILVDDGSSDRTQEIFEQMRDPIVYVRSDSNNGFLRSCNAGAARARGSYIVLLNNDTIVFPEWLDSLIDTLDLHDDAGIVGSKLLFPNGRLQEAGGIIWNDASGWNFGRGDDPNKPQYNYLREVDYCSACSIALSKTFWETLSGFDDKFAPAYYEDTDIAFRARENGKKVFYQPLSKLIHFEGVTSGTSTASGAKAYQEINKTTFFRRWEKTIAGHGTPEFLSAAIDRYSEGRILVVDASTPTPDKDSGSLDMLNLLRIFKLLKKSVVFLPLNLNSMDGYTRNLEQMGVHCLAHPHFHSVRDAISHFGPHLEFVFLCRATVASAALDFVRYYAPRAKVIFNTVDLHFLREYREAMLFGTRSLRDRAEHRIVEEIDLIRKAEATIVLSKTEKILLSELIPEARLFEIGLIREVPPAALIHSFDSRKDVAFVGGFSHTPNVDAVVNFVIEIWPILCQKGYDGDFIIIGSNMPAKIKMLASKRIIIRGFVNDLEAEFGSLRVSIAPLQYGAGLKGKVASSLGYGVPCVATSIAVEGAGLTEGVGVLLADTPREFASKVISLYTDEQLWNRTAESGRKFFLDNYSLPVVQDKVDKMLAEVHAMPSGTYSSSAA